MTGQPQPTLDEIRDWPATVGVPAACAALGIGKSAGYDAVRRGVFPVSVIRVGNRCRVVTASLIQALEGASGDGNAREIPVITGPSPQVSAPSLDRSESDRARSGGSAA